MESGEWQDLDCDVLTEVAEEGARDETEAESSEEEEEIAHSPVTLREARACMARVAEFMQVNSDTRGLSRFVDVCIEMQSELDKTVVTAGHHQSLLTKFMKPIPKITTISSPQR